MMKALIAVLVLARTFTLLVSSAVDDHRIRVKTGKVVQILPVGRSPSMMKMLRHPDGSIYLNTQSTDSSRSLARSDDDGATWSEPILVINSQAEHLPIFRTVQVGNLWTDPLGRLWLFFNQTMNRFDGRDGLWVTVSENPDDEELTWSVPRYLWPGSALNKPIVLSDGDWMLPVQLFDHMDGGRGPFKVGVFPELDPVRGANVLVSSDQGHTWTRRGGRRFPEPNFYEHHVLEREGGSLWMLARTQNGIMQSHSRDKGLTWAAPTRSTINHPVARFHVQRLQSGRVLLVKHGETIDAHEGRSKLTAWLSDDEGRTWTGGLMLDERTGISYPDGFQAPDGMIYTSYDRNRAMDAEILIAKFSESDVVARRLVDPRSRLRTVVRTKHPAQRGIR